MARDRSYSIKFKSEGLQALLKDLKSASGAFDSVLADSQKSVDKVLRDRSKAIVGEAQDEARRTTAAIGASSPKVVAFKNENSITPRLVVYNSPFKGDSTKAPPDPLAKLPARDRALVEVWRTEYRNFFTEFKTELRDGLKGALQKDDALSLAGRIISTPFNIIGDLIKFPIEATLLGVFSGFGEKLTADFSKGFKGRFEKSLGLELQSIGQDIGDIVGQSVYRSYEAANKAVRNMVLSSSDDKMPQVGELIEDLKKILLGTLIQGAVVPLKAHKRIQLTKKALPQVMNQAGELLINQTPTATEVDSIQKQKSITLLVGGVNNDPLANNTEYASRLLQPLLGDSHVVPIKNFWSNSKIGPEFKEFVVSLVRNIFSNETLSKGAVDFLKNQGFDKTLNLEQFKGLSLENQEQFIDEIVNFFEAGKLPFGRLLESAYQGYNPDDIMVAAQALYYKQAFPNKPLNIIGTSGGGFNAAGAIEILNKLGYQDIKGAGITTPFTGLEYTGNPDDFYGSIGTKDPYYQMIYGSALKGIVDPPGFMQIAPGVGMGHLLASYVGTPEFQNFFQWFFKDRIKIPKGMGGDVMNYISRRRQNPEDENLQRTLLKAFGAPVEGYTFNANDLSGLTAEIKKKAARIKDKDIKADAQIFLDFLDTLTEELKIIEVLGEQFKPFKSLEKAALVYPELELFASFNEEISSDDALKQAVKQQLEVQQLFINFKTKIKAEADNIKRTLQSMRGEKVEGYAFYDGAEYEKRAGHLGGLIGHLEKDLLKGATPKQQAQAYKYINYLKRLQAGILERGKGGAIDPQLEAEGQQLFGFSLAGTAPAPTKEQRRAKIPKSAKQIADEYNNYLEQLRKATSEGFGGASDLPQTIKAIKQQLGEYRKAIESGQLEIAKNLGENLLEIISAIKQTASSTEINPQTIGTLTRYQNEILKGDKGKGRAQTGLTQLAESNADFQALLRQSQSVGPNVAKGVTIGIKQNLGGVAKAGEELGEALIKGTEGKLEINSPSEWGKRTAKFVVAGLKLGLAGIKNIFALDVAESIKIGIQDVEAQATKSIKAAQQRMQTIDIDAIDVEVGKGDYEATEAPPSPDETPLQMARRRIREAKERAAYAAWDEPLAPFSPWSPPKKNAQGTQAALPFKAPINRFLPPGGNTPDLWKLITSKLTPGWEARLAEELWRYFDFWNLPTSSPKLPVSKAPQTASSQRYLPARLPITRFLPPGAETEDLWSMPPSGATGPAPKQAKPRAKAPLILPAVADSRFAALIDTASVEAQSALSAASDEASRLMMQIVASVMETIQSGEQAAQELALFSESEANALRSEIARAVQSEIDRATKNATNALEDSVEAPIRALALALAEISQQMTAAQVRELKNWKLTLLQIVRAAIASLKQSIPYYLRKPTPALPPASRYWDPQPDPWENYVAPRQIPYEPIPDPWDNPPPPKPKPSLPPRGVTIDVVPIKSDEINNMADYARFLGWSEEEIQSWNKQAPRLEAAKTQRTLDTVPGPNGDEIDFILAPNQANDAKAKNQIQKLLDWIKGRFQKFGSSINREFFDRIFDTDGVNSSVDNTFGRIFGQIGEFFEGLEEQFPIITRFKGVIASIGVSLLAAFGVFTGGDIVIRLGQQALETARKFEQLDRVIVSASGSAEKGAANLRFIGEEAKRLSLDLEVAKSAYGKLLASAIGTSLEGEATNQIFSAVGEAALNKGLNREGQERVFLAIQQIISKGKVSAEELRQQLGEALPGTLQTAARALGVTTQQIDKMLQSGELVATDFLPKFAAQLSAENAGGVAGAANSAQASLTRFNNSLTEFQIALGQGLQPAEKLGLNVLSVALDVLRDQAGNLVKALLALVMVLGWQLIAKLVQSKAAAEGLALGFKAIRDAILSALPAIASFLARFVLMTAAIETWLNVYRLTQDSFKDIAAYANESAKGLDNLARAYKEAGNAASDFQPKNPKRDRDLVSQSGIDFYGLKLNLDTLYRKPLDWLFEQFGGSFATQGQREFNDFLVNASGLMSGARGNAQEASNAKEIIAQIQQLDQQLETIRSKAHDLLPGDRAGLQKSIEQEQALLKERERLLKITSTISTNFARDIENLKKTLEAIEKLPEGANTDAIRAQLEAALAALSQSQSAFDQLISSVSRNISESDRRLRNLTEGLSQFNDALEKMATLARGRTIREGLNRGLTRSQIDRQLQELSIWENQQKASQLNKSIAQIQKDLQNPLQQQTVQNLGINPETVGSAQLERMLGEGRSTQEQSTLKTVQKLKQLQQEAANAEYSLAQAQQALQEAQFGYFQQLYNFWLSLRRQFEDLSIQTSDVLEDLRRQFVSVVQQIKQTNSQAAFTSLKAILTQPLVTQAERLINATNDAFEQYLNSLTSEIEQAFSRAALDFNLEQQMEQLGNAITDANRQQRDRVRNSTRQGEDTRKQWWEIQRQSPLTQAGTGAVSAVTSNALGNKSGSGATTSNQGSESGANQNTQSLSGMATGASSTGAGLNPMIPDGILQQSEQNISNDIANQPAIIQQANDATGAATQQQIAALQAQRAAVEQLTSAQRALGEVEARLSAQQRRNNLLRYLQETGYGAESLSNQVDDLEDKYSPSTPQRQNEAARRSIEQEYLNLGRQTRNQLNTLTQQRDRFQELSQILTTQGIPGLQAYQQQLLQTGNTTGAEALQKIINSVSEDASFLERQLPEIQGLIDKYEQELSDLSNVYKLAKDRQALLNEFNIQTFELEKTKTINQLDNQLREAQASLLGNTYGRKTEAADLERKKALTDASDRYEQQKLELEKDIALNPSKYSETQVQRLFSALEQWFDATIEQIDRQFQVRINFDQREYNLQKTRSVNDIQGQLYTSAAGLGQAQGDEFNANSLLQKQATVGENDRYQQQLFDLEKDAALNPNKYSIEELDQLKAKLLEINSINLQSIDRQFKDLGETLTDLGAGALEEFFTSIFTNTKSVGEAFRDMALSILRSIAQIAAKQAVLGILKVIGMATGTPVVSTPAYASGGSVSGPGTGTSDSILARLSNGEFVMRASAVRYWGEDFLADLNGMRTPKLAFASNEVRGGNSSRVSTPTVIVNVTSPDINSFRRSESQIGREAGEMYRRSVARNS